MKINKYTDLDTNARILLGPGPSMVPSRVLRALTAPMVGYLDPQYTQVMDDIRELLRAVFQTKNEVALSISGTGSAAMEASICNFVEPGDDVLIAIHGFFGERLYEMAKRYGANVDRIDKPWGEIFTPDEIRKALEKKSYKVFAIVHGETSTGAVQNGIKEIAQATHDNGALMILDTVASLGGIPVKTDEWGVDVVYSGSQKGLSAPPGLAPITFNQRASDILAKRKTPVTSFYLDLNLIQGYWQAPRSYHHTGPISMNYALREALRVVLEEGLDNSFARHKACAEQLWDGMEDLGFSLLMPKEQRLITLTTPLLPEGLDDAAIRKQLLNDYNIEVAGGFGPLAGKIWRIGLMGYSARKENVTLFLAALKEVIA